MKFLNFLVLLALISCGSASLKRDVDEAGYQTSGVEQFFLPELPAWANFSPSGMCFKSSSFSYLNFKKLKDSYQLSYGDMIELQGQYNARVENYFRSAAVKFLKPVEEASFFSNTLEQIRGGVRAFKLPSVKEVDVVWLDSFIADQKIDELKKMAKNGKFDERLPVLFSSCLSRQSMSQWITEHNLEEAGFYTLGAEWLSSYDADGKPLPQLHVDLKKFLGPEIKVHFLSSGSHNPSQILKID